MFSLKRMILQKKKILPFVLSMMLIITLFSASVTATSETKNDTISLSREEAISLALNNSGTLRDMNESLDSLNETYDNMRDGIEALKSLYNKMSRYSALEGKYARTMANNDYSQYFQYQMQLASIQPQIAELQAIPADELTPEQSTKLAELLVELDAINTGISALNLSDSEIGKIITIAEYYEYAMIKSAYSSMGFDFTADSIYNTFIYPIYVAPVTLKSNIDALNVGIETAEAGTISGVEQLYSSLLSLNSFYNLQASNYNLKKRIMDYTRGKYNLGLVSEMDYKKAVNDFKVAELEKNQMERKMDSLEMMLKQMVGIDLSRSIALSDEMDTDQSLRELDYYINQALTNRNEILTAQINTEDKENTMKYVKQYLSVESPTFGIAEDELNKQNLSTEITQNSIIKEIRAAYTDVSNKKADMQIALQDLKNTKNSLSNMQKYFDLGFITEDQIDGYKILELQKESNYLTAKMNFTDSIRSLNSAIEIGPAYNTSGGGISDAQ